MNKSRQMAMGGVLAAAAMVIMCLGGIIPVATYICPMLCAVVLYFVLQLCGKRIAWAWYFAVALLSLLLGPDKEAALVFVLLGYYPIIKPMLDRVYFSWIWKLLLFNGTIVLLYKVIFHLLGMDEITEAFQELGIWMLAVMLILGNMIFILLDRFLDILGKRKWKK